jgi:hypothetical protein
VPQQTQIFVGENRDGSSDYEIPGNAEIRVLAVNATFEDNGAGADWLPAVVMFSDSGSVISRALLPDVKVTAGDDAEVSWFPGVKPGGGAATGTALAYARAWNDLFNGDPAQTIPAGATRNASFAHTETTDSSVISFHTSVNPNDTADLLASGSYIMYCGSHWDVGSTDISSLIQEPGGGENAFPHTPINPNTFPSFGDGVGSAQSQDFAVKHAPSGGASERVLLDNRDVADRDVQQCYFVIIYLGTG